MIELVSPARIPVSKRYYVITVALILLALYPVFMTNCFLIIPPAIASYILLSYLWIELLGISRSPVKKSAWLGKPPLLIYIVLFLVACISVATSIYYMLVNGACFAIRYFHYLTVVFNVFFTVKIASRANVA